MSRQKWFDGEERIEEMLSENPKLAAREQKMTLSMIRRAAGLTQVALAESLKMSQSAVARTEQRPDMLLSTLHSYLAAVGAKARIIVELADGRSVEVSLEEASKS